MNRLTLTIVTAFIISSFSKAQAQELPKGWVMYFEAAQGMVTDFKSAPDTYTGSLLLNPQVTLIPSHLRLGAIAGLDYNDKTLFGLFGPQVSWKLTDFKAGQLGSIGNVQAQIRYLWGGAGQRLIGGGLTAELGQLLTLGITVHRDYALNTWWFQTGIGFNLLHKKRSSTPVDPFQKNN